MDEIIMGILSPFLAVGFLGMMTLLGTMDAGLHQPRTFDTWFSNRLFIDWLPSDPDGWDAYQRGEATPVFRVEAAGGQGR